MMELGFDRERNETPRSQEGLAWQVAYPWNPGWNRVRGGTASRHEHRRTGEGAGL